MGSSRKARPSQQASRLTSLLRGGRVLLVEPNELTRWSVATYLQRWFAVEAVETAEAAVRLVGGSSFVALVLSDQLAHEEAAEIRRRAAEHNPGVSTIRTVTGMSEAEAAEPQTVQLEKPFELAGLARLLGVPEQELAAG